MVYRFGETGKNEKANCTNGRNETLRSHSCRIEDILYSSKPSSCLLFTPTYIARERGWLNIRTKTMERSFIDRDQGTICLGSIYVHSYIHTKVSKISVRQLKTGSLYPPDTVTNHDDERIYNIHGKQ